MLSGTICESAGERHEAIHPVQSLDGRGHDAAGAEERTRGP